MVKGITQQVVVFRPKDTGLFDRAILFLREDSLEKYGVGEQELLEEARRIAGNCIPARKKRRNHPLLWFGAGSLFTGLFWILSLLF